MKGFKGRAEGMRMIRSRKERYKRMGKGVEVQKTAKEWRIDGQLGEM